MDEDHSTAEGIWRRKSDAEVTAAAAQLDEYTEEGRQIIRNEVERRLEVEIQGLERRSADSGDVVVSSEQAVQSRAEGIWRRKTDVEVTTAAAQLDEYTEEGRQFIRNEVDRRHLTIEDIHFETTEDIHFETTDSEAIAPKVGLIRSLWHGDTPLWITYWLFAVLGGRILVLPFSFIENNSIDLFPIFGFELLYWTLVVCVLAYSLFALLAVWRSAGKYKGSRAIAGLARTSVAFGFITTFLAIGQTVTSSISEDSLQEEARVVNLQLPRTLDENLRLERVSASGLSLTFHYTLVGEPATNYDPEQFRSEMLPGLLIEICGDFREHLDSEVQIAYAFLGSDGTLVNEIQVRREHCVGISGLAVGSSAELHTTDIAALAMSAFATIVANPGEPSEAFGSGFIVRSDGVIVTNLHVVEGAENVEVRLPDGQVFDDVDVLGADEFRDILVLQLPTTGLSALALGDDEEVKVGEEIYVLGNPQGYDQTFSDGLLSAIRSIGGREYLQISAPISKGSSGGPVVNTRGEAIAIASRTVADAQNLNLAVPVRYIYGILADALKKPFREFMETADFTYVSDDRDDRRADSAALARDASPEFIESISGLAVWQQVVTLRVLASDVAMAGTGWIPYGETLGWDLVAPSQRVRSSIFLEAGAYVAAGVCDDDCTDLDLFAYDESGTLLNSDEEIDSEPVVGVTVITPGEYFFEASMYECETDKCLYAVRVYAMN